MVEMESPRGQGAGTGRPTAASTANPTATPTLAQAASAGNYPPGFLDLVTFRHKQDNKPKSERLTYAKLIERLSRHERRHKKDGPLFSLASYRPDTTRGNANVLTVNAAVFDIDHGDYELAIEKLDPYGWLAYSTFSSTEEDQRFRLIVFFDKPLDASLWKSVEAKISYHLLNSQVDRGTNDEARAFHWPAAKPDALVFSVYHHGELLDPLALPEVPAAAVVVPPSASGSPERPLGRAALRFVAFGADYGLQRKTACAVARDCASCGLPVEKAAEFIWKGFQASKQDANSPWTYDHAVQIARDIYMKPAPPLKCPTLVTRSNGANGHVNGFCDPTSFCSVGDLPARVADNGDRGESPGADPPYDVVDDLTLPDTTPTVPEWLPFSPRPLTDLGNAERLVAAHGADLHYCHRWGKWLVWDSKRFQEDATAEIERRAKQTVRLIYAEAAEAIDENERKAIADWAKKSESRQRIEAMIELAKSEPGIPVMPNELDADGWLLNVENGTIDLRTGGLREHRREDLITKLANVVYDESAHGGLWDKHVEMFLPAANVRRQVQRDIGRALVGSTLEESLQIWFGGGANGKTTTSRAVLAALGDYADRAAPNLLIASKQERHPTEVADLRGKRIIFSVEVDQGKQLAEALVKDLSGGDRKKARFMHQDFFSFEQTFSLFLIVNHKPIITGADEGIWRRVRLIPWEYRIPESEKRPQDEVLRELAAGGSAILNWLLAGLRDWQQDHSWTAPEVRAANDAYRAEMDVLGAFIADCCVIGPWRIVAKSQLYEGYTGWCTQAGEEAVSKKAFTQTLRSRGIADRKGTGGERQYVGIALAVADSGSSSGNSSMSRDSKKLPEQVPLSATNAPGVGDYCELLNADGTLAHADTLPVLDVRAYEDGQTFCEFDDGGRRFWWPVGRCEAVIEAEALSK